MILGMVVTWINLERALLEKTFIEVQSKGGKKIDKKMTKMSLVMETC